MGCVKWACVRVCFEPSVRVYVGRHDTRQVAGVYDADVLSFFIHSRHFENLLAETREGTHNNHILCEERDERERWLSVVSGFTRAHTTVSHTQQCRTYTHTNTHTHTHTQRWNKSVEQEHPSHKCFLG